MGIERFSIDFFKESKLFHSLCELIKEKQKKLFKIIANSYLFSEPTKDDILIFREKVKKLKKFAQNKGLLLSGGWRSDGPEMGINIVSLSFLC